MKKISKILLLVFLSFLFLFYSNAKNISEKGSNIKNDLKKTKTENINSKLAYNVNSSKIPLYFIQNKGQYNKKALFYARTSKYTIWITKKGLIFDSVRKNKEDKTQHSKLNTQNSTLIKRDVSRLLFKGANKSPKIVPVDKTKYRVHYFTGKDKSKWKTGIKTSKVVMYKNIYPYIDLKVYGKEKQIEYDWIVNPGGNPENIRFEFKDVKGTELDNKGNIIIKTEFGKLEHKRPASYQIKEKGKREIIKAKFKRIKNNIYKFEIENYDKNKTLIIDPVVLIYSTYLGGGDDDYGGSIAIDTNGCAYVAGTTHSIDFPLQNPYQANNQGREDVFITKLSFNAIAIVRASVSGGNGSATPSKQSVTYGSNASITITPALGYEIASITDNRVLQTITNPYIIENVTKDHLVVITFKLSDLIVRASVSGGNGSATPSTQSVAYGSNASITITPALGYEIASITDNGVLQTITNPYIIENVIEDHLVVVTFKVYIRLSMTGVRKTERAWIIKRDYGELNFLVDNPSQVNVSKYVIYKKINNETYEALYEFSGSSLNLGSYIYIDKFLNKDKTYTYKFIAYDSSNNIIAISNEISI